MMLSKMNVYYVRLKELITEGNTVSEIIQKAFRLIKKELSRYWTVIFEIGYSFLKCFRNKLFHECKNNKDTSILLILPTALGDTIVSMQAFSKIDEWSKFNNKSVIVVCRDIARSILEKYVNCNNLLFYEFIDENRTSFNAYRRMVLFLSRYHFEKIVVCDIPIRGRRLLPMCLYADEKIFYGFKMGNSDFFDRFQIKHVFDKYVCFPEDTFYMDIIRKIVTDIGVDFYKTEIFKANIKNLPRMTKEYVLLCPEASCVERSLNPAFCDMIVNRLKKEYETEILISISGRNEDYSKEIFNIASSNNIKAFIGNTTIERLFEIVSSSKLVIGCDSGTVHVAAACQVKSICIKGHWQTGYFQPYKLDECSEYVPCVIYGKEYDCSYCEERGEQMCNPQCRSLVSDGKSYLCLSDYSYIMDRLLQEINNKQMIKKRKNC